MNLIDVYDVANAPRILFDLNYEDAQSKNEWETHCDYISSRPYREWMLIANDEGYIVGAVYLTKHNEIGVRIFKSERGKGYGRFALMAIMGRHPGERMRANIHPRNEKALRMFSTFGFKLSQVTVETTVKCE